MGIYLLRSVSSDVASAFSWYLVLKLGGPDLSAAIPALSSHE